MSLAFDHISFTHTGAAVELFEDLTAHFGPGWTGIAGPNGAGKTTVLRIAAGELHPQRGTVRRPAHAVFCPQRTDNMPPLLPEFISAAEPEAYVLRGRLRIGMDWADRWDTLSHGERKRSQIAVALWQQPGVLLVDEPTNHIDKAARQLLADALASFRGTGLLVSHDRDLLDLLCSRCLFLDPPRAVMRPGNYSAAAGEERREEMSVIAKRRSLEMELERLTSESQRRQAEAARADSRRSKRKLARGDNDGRARIDLARVSGKDGKAGQLSRQLDSRIERTRVDLDDLSISKHYSSFWLDASVSPRTRLFSIPPCLIDLGGTRKLSVPEFSMLRTDRAAITGANGLGKSTFIRYLLSNMNLPGEHVVYLPQEIDLDSTRGIMSGLHRLPREQLGRVMTVVSGLGSRPERLLGNIDVSPGELRKVLLALGVIRHPHLIIMDEPTNHLDITAIECLEKALSGCPCALLLVSHDQRFLDSVTDVRWELEQNGDMVEMRMKDGMR
jgi:ATPase subunit of ABC transporter with duplicated ATPase domains